jgi:cytochrome c oxidase assembly protein subunit 15
LNQFKNASGCGSGQGQALICAIPCAPPGLFAAPLSTRAHTMSPIEHRHVVLRRLALLCAVMVLAVTSLSAYIRLSKAGLGCADWPQCYGQSLRQVQRGVAPGADKQTATAMARLAHRVAAVAALLLVLTMVMVCYGSRPVLRAEGAMALVLLALAIFLAVLGRWSSDARIPAVAMGNLLGGFAMLALSARLTVAGRPWRAVRPRSWVVVAVLALLVQVALGGLVSASYAGLSCSGAGDCLAAARGIEWATLNPWREPVLSAVAPVNPTGALPQVLHRGLALALVLLLAPLALAARRNGRPRMGAALLGLVVLQAGAGLAMVASDLPLVLALAHNLLASGLLAVLVLLL